MEDPLSFDGDSSSARNQAIEWVHAVEIWQNHRTADALTMESFQIRCLVLLSRKVNEINSKQNYTVSQTLLPDTISCGLHRASETLSTKESIFDKELHRKMWSAVAELELFNCMDQGFSSMVSNLRADIGQPSNINKSELNETSEEAPGIHRF